MGEGEGGGSRERVGARKEEIYREKERESETERRWIGRYIDTDR